MRGSPIFRFIFLTLALIATGVGLLRLTSAKVPQKKTAVPTTRQALESMPVPYRLVLSAPAREVKIDTGKGSPAILTDNPALSGKLSLDRENPNLSISVAWKNPATAGEHRFAKLILEIPGSETFTHVFDADGDIDDFLELPLPAAK